MKKSMNLQRKQKTEYTGLTTCKKVEPSNTSKMLSKELMLSNRERVNDESSDTSNLMEKVVSYTNMKLAIDRVIKNKGSHGVDGMKTDELLGHINKHWYSSIKIKLLDGTYKPSPVRRVEIPEQDGGIRLLGIPTVLDRTIQQAIAQVLTPIYEDIFSDSSYGFRPNRDAKKAILKAKQYINEGNKYVVDMDLEKFFDKVNHDILMNKLGQRVKDKRLLELIRKYLKSGIMTNGVQLCSDEGTPQGGPLSPLLANIMLDEMDKELEARGHKFCRYADDCNIYVKSARAGERVMESMIKLLEGKLKLKVNRNKSAVNLVSRRKFLGFSFYFTKGGAEIKIHEKSYRRFRAKIREVTNRNKGISMESRLIKLNQITIGWLNYYSIAKGKSRIRELEGWIRRRLRACIWKTWKRVRTRYKNLIKAGIPKYKAWEFANTRKGYWRISNSPVLSKSLTNTYLAELGFISISKRYQMIH